MRRIGMVLGLLLGLSVSAMGSNVMLDPAYLNHLNSTTTWDIVPENGDGTRGFIPDNFPVIEVIQNEPSHAAAFLGNGFVDTGASAGLKYFTYVYDPTSYNSNSIIDTNALTVGCWVKLDLPKTGGAQHILRVQGSYTNEFVSIDYAGSHNGQLRMIISGGDPAGSMWLWEQSIYAYDNTIGQDPVSKWFYVGLRYKSDPNMSNPNPDEVTPFLFDANGNNITAGTVTTEPSGRIAGDGELRLNNGLFVGMYSTNPSYNFTPEALDEINIQGYLSEEEIQSQVTKMAAGEELEFYGQPIMQDAVFLHHYNDATTWDVVVENGDYTAGDGAALVSGATLIHGSEGLLGQSQIEFPAGAAKLEYLTSHDGSSIINHDEWTVGCWVELDLPKTEGAQEIVKLHGSYTNEHVKMDYANYHYGALRMEVYGGDPAAQVWRWEQYLWAYDNTVGEDQISKWFYIALRYKKSADGVSPDEITPFVFDTQGNNITAGDLHAEPTGPVAGDGELSLHDRLTLGSSTTVDRNPIAMDEVNIQGYLSDAQLASQVLSMANGLQLLAGEPCSVKPKADITGDCMVDMRDLAALASEWMKCNLSPAYLCDE